MSDREHPLLVTGIAPAEPESTEANSENTGEASRRTFTSARSIVLICIALGLVIGSIAISQHSVTSTNPRFIQLSVVPSPVSAGANARVAKLGVENLAATDIDVIVRVKEGSRPLLTTDLSNLAPGATWTRSLTRDPSEKFTVTVSYTSHPGKIVRSAYLNSPAT
jgi:hypothetical protein